jgi:enoyl-CoA hydratase/carnithine racemase
MSYEGLTALRVRIAEGVATVTIDHPPINLFDLALIAEMDRVGRALEIALGADDFPADLAERYGYVNRALPADEIGPFVDRLAKRIASFPAEAIAHAKASVLAADAGVRDGLVAEARAFDACVALPEARRRMEAFLAMGGQTREVEAKTGAFG